jgi:predicted kinase
MQDRGLIDEIDALLPESPTIRDGGSLLLMAGLPGSGKSSIVQDLHRLLPFVVISTDWMRMQLCSKPAYTAAEQEKVYNISYALIVRRLERGQRVVFDASNYLAARREYVLDMASKCKAPVAIALVQASQEMIRQRLMRRMSQQRPAGDLSDADWSVYKWMVEKQEPILEPHIILDTSESPASILADQLCHYWLKVESDAAGNLDLQPPSWASKFISSD